jgi:hypothetical protein
VAGAGATIEIPPGALTAATTITIDTLFGTKVTDPPGYKRAAPVYRFGANATFQADVTITVAVDDARKPSTGVLVLFRSESPRFEADAQAQYDWFPKTAGNVPIGALTVSTKELSADWTLAAAEELPCFLGGESCLAAASDGGFACRMPPAADSAVRCAGSRCACDVEGAHVVPFDGGPSASALSALAAACGATCEKGCAPITCEPDAGPPDPDSGAGNGVWSCTTSLATNPLTCSQSAKAAPPTCACANPPGDASVPSADTPRADTLFKAWAQSCGGLCLGATEPIDATAGD